MKQRKKRETLLLLGYGLSGVPLLPMCAYVASLLGGADFEEAELASAVGFFLSLGWLGVCSAIAFTKLLIEIYEENLHE